jgi:proline iminopeptidase
MSVARVNGVELFYETVGEGEPLLMLHGNGLDHTYLRPWHDGIADHTRVIYYDQRWNGRSERKGPIDHATSHADALALLDHLGESRATVYGHSYGAWLALGFAARHPERVARLILSGTSPAFDYVPEVIANAQARDPVAASYLIEGLQHGVATDADLATIWQRILPLYFFGPPRPEILADVRFSARGFGDAMAALDGFSMVNQLPTMSMPILVLAGIADYITPPSQARRIASLAPNATVVELTKSGHFPFVEETAAYLDAIRRWVTAAPSGP